MIEFSNIPELKVNALPAIASTDHAIDDAWCVSVCYVCESIWNENDSESNSYRSNVTKIAIQILKWLKIKCTHVEAILILL